MTDCHCPIITEQLNIIEIGRMLDVGHESYFSYVYAEVHNVCSISVIMRIFDVI
jgi:hypothetical protein